ncbi:MAG TPA: efflux RND transporter periplasmic adaptor subunit [Prolixibacteraceae bacterium]|nr:efflux RND transporter periplasmic adaptor subunit [Prolixibacteraceae bacterium]
MKNIIYALAITAALVSCNQSTDKKGELEKLKVQHDELATKIANLEAEVYPNGIQGESKSITVKIEPVTNCVFTHYIEVQGVVDGDKNVAVSPQTGGIITAVYVTEGSNVKKGQVMAELDAVVLKQSLVELRTQLDLATNLFEKQKALWAKNIGSEIQFLQAKTNKEGLENKIKTMQGQIDMASVISPINGTVESMPLKVGQMASPGQPTSAIRVINMNLAKIKADVSENYSSKIENGNKVIVRFPDLGKEIESKLSFVSRFIDPTNRTFQVECKIQSGEVVLRANMIAYVKIKDYLNEKAICIPVNYVQSNKEGKYIYVAVQKANQWVATKRQVKEGMNYNGVTEILEGLAEGDKVVSSGYQNLNEGSQIIF